MKLSTVCLFLAVTTSVVGSQVTPPTAKPKVELKAKPKPKHLLRYALHKGRAGEFDFRASMWTKGDSNPSKEDILRRCRWKILSVDSGWADVEFRFTLLKDSNVKDIKKSEAGLKGPIRVRMNTLGQFRVPEKMDDDGVNGVTTLRMLVRELPVGPVAVGDQWASRVERPVGRTLGARIVVRNTVASFQKGQVRINFSMSFNQKQGGATTTIDGSQGFLDYRLGDFLPSRMSQRLRMSVKFKQREMWSIETVLQVAPPGKVSREDPFLSASKVPKKSGGKAQATKKSGAEKPKGRRSRPHGEGKSSTGTRLP